MINTPLNIIVLSPWINLGLFLVQLAIDIFKDDDIEIWLKRCRFGTAQLGLSDDYRYRYLTAEDEINALKAIFDKFIKQAMEYQAEQEEIEEKKRQKAVESTISPAWQKFNRISFK